MSRRAGTVYIIQMNHFDPIWRRCWDRRFEYAGRTYASYADVEEAVIDDWLAAAERGPTTFILEQTVSLRKYLERRPERLETLRTLAKEGRFELLASGEVIPDANMPMGESLVRNLVYGILWAERTLGVPVNIGCRNDGFGSSAQAPQIFRQCEVRWLPFLSYRVPDNDYWQGLDGTTIYVGLPEAKAFNGQSAKHAPCESCRGKGCDACLGRGFDQSGRLIIDNWLTDLKGQDIGYMTLGGEETLPCPDLAGKAARWAESTPGITYRFGTFADIGRHLARDIEAADDPPPERVSREPDLALSSAGCWVTRIKLKQRNRRAEHHLLVAETLAALAWVQGAPYPADKLTDAWRTLTFTQFHDALTATHVDPAYDELMGMYDAVDATARTVSMEARRRLGTPQPPTGDRRSVTVFNTMSWARSERVRIELDPWPTVWATASDERGELPVYKVEKNAAGPTVVTLLARDVPPLGGKTIHLAPCPQKPSPEDSRDGSIENDRFRVVSNENGITSICDKRHHGELIDCAHDYAGELILEHDYGDPWATRRPDHQRERLSPFGRRVAARREPGRSVITFEGKHPGNFHDFEVTWLTWRQEVVLWDGLPYVEFTTEVDWDTHNRRLRVVFPTTVRNDTGDYEIPYGTLRRRRYDARTYEPSGVNGDWPTVHWAAPASPGGSVAVINRGECSFRIEGGHVLVSLLRSPGTPWCLHEPQFYRMPLFDGMRDSGVHRFHLALYPFAGPWPESDVTQQAWSYNAPLLAVVDHASGSPPGIALRAKGTMISTLKRAEEGEALIIRLYEYAGLGETVELAIPAGIRKAHKVNLLERQPERLPITDGKIQIEMRPFKLVTVRLER